MTRTKTSSNQATKDTVHVHYDGTNYIVQVHHWDGTTLLSSGPERPFTNQYAALTAADKSVTRRLGIPDGRPCLLTLGPGIEQEVS